MRSFLVGLIAGAAGVLFGLNHFGHISMSDFMPGSVAVEDSAGMMEEAAEADDAMAEDAAAEAPAAEEAAPEEMMEEGEAVVEEDMGDAEEEAPAEDG
jgi:hypothetical protein